MTPETMPGAEFLQPDKLFDHHRQQLSAMMDGALAPDQARFLLRRLQHDTDLTACWERWQLAGDVLRGDADALLSRDFAQRIATAIAAPAAASVPAALAGRPRWARWGGSAALAASVAVAALLVWRQVPNADNPSASGPARVVVAAPPTPGPGAAPSMPIAAQQMAATPAGAIAVAEVPRRNVPRRSRGQSQRVAIRNAARRIEPSAPATPRGVAAADAIADATAADPFAIGAAAVPGRPWPRAVGPNAPANGGFTVGLGNSAAAPSFHPFEPRVPTGDAAADHVPRDADGASPQIIADDPTPR